MIEVTDGEDQGEAAEDDEQHPGGGGEPLRSLRLLGNAQKGHFVNQALMEVYWTGCTWGNGCVFGQQLGGQGGGDGQGGDDHQRGDNAAAGGGPLAGGRVGHGGVVLALGIGIDFSPSLSVYFQVDRVIPTCGDKHCASGHGRRGGKGKLWKSEDSLLFSHLPVYRALRAPQDRCDGSVGF